ncbi:MAG: glycosyltransferase [Lentisphaeria bacterium]|nr:glycosyltransferase [Lentisphaeria bacterium]
MKRILFLIPNLMHGGAEKVLVNLVNNLDPTKYDVTLYSIFDHGVNKDALDKGVKYQYRFKWLFRGNSFFFKFFSPAFLYKWMLKDEYDIVISFLEGVAARIVSGCPFSATKKVAWLHIELNNEAMARVGFRSIAEARECYRKFDSIIGVSATVVAMAKKTIGENLPYRVLYNTNETDQIRKKARDPADIDFEKGMINICSVAKIMKTKGYDRLLKAHSRLIDEGFPHAVHIFGCGGELKKLERHAKKLGVSESFTFHGFRKNPYKYVSKCDLYVCSSRREGFSTAVTEALIMGVPVVSTDCSGAKELLGENDEFGLVVENSEEGVYRGIKRILSEPGLLERYRKQATIRGERFSTSETVKAVEEMLENL